MRTQVWIERRGKRKSNKFAPIAHLGNIMAATKKRHLEDLNRCVVVTDKLRCAWQKLVIDAKASGQFVVRCSGGAGCIREARVSSAFESLRKGAAN